VGSCAWAIDQRRERAAQERRSIDFDDDARTLLGPVIAAAASAATVDAHGQLLRPSFFLSVPTAT